MTCYIDLTVDNSKLPNCAKLKQTSDLANAILRGGVDFGYGRKELTLGKGSSSNFIFRSNKYRRNQYLKEVTFFYIENKNQENVHIYLPYQELKDCGLKFLITDGNTKS